MAGAVHKVDKQKKMGRKHAQTRAGPAGTQSGRRDWALNGVCPLCVGGSRRRRIEVSRDRRRMNRGGMPDESISSWGSGHLGTSPW